MCDEVVWDHDPLREQEWGSLGASADDSYDPADSPGWDVPSRSLTDSASSSFEFESGLLADAERLRNTMCLQLANQVAQVVGYKGKIDWDMNMPDGTPKKQLDVSRLRMMGWKASTTLEEGLTLAYQNFQDAIAGECLRR